MADLPGDIQAAAELLRANGYAVVTAWQARFWDAWLSESHERERALHDELTRTVQEIGFLESHCAELLNGSRPMWWRAFRKRWANHKAYRMPVIGVDPRVSRPSVRERLEKLEATDA